MAQYLDPKFLIEAVGLVGVIAIIFAESGLFFGFFFPGDSLLFTAGLLASQSILSLPVLLIGTFIAAVVGDNVGYAFGRKVGPALFSKEDSFFFNKKHVERSRAFFDKHGKKALILVRFMPIVRTFTPILAGVGSMEYKSFFAYNVVGGFIWTFSMTLLGYFLGSVIPDPDRYVLPIVLAIVILSILPALRHIKFKKHD